MLCFQCRRLAVAAAARPSSALSRTSRLLGPYTTALTAATATPSSLPTLKALPTRRHSSALHYSTTSDAAAANPAANPAAPSSTPSVPEKPDYLDDAESAIWDKLANEFSPTQLMVQDISGGCGSMYGIEIASDKFRGASMLKQQRMVNAVLGDQMKGWHGVQLRTRVP